MTAVTAWPLDSAPLTGHGPGDPNLTVAEGGTGPVEYWPGTSTRLPAGPHPAGRAPGGGTPPRLRQAVDLAFPKDRSFNPMTIGPETCYRVRGGIPLQGTVFVQGAKNAALKMIAASLLTGEGRTVLRNVPRYRGCPPRGRTGAGRGRGRQVPRGRAHPRGGRLQADQLRPAGRDRPPVPRLGAVRAGPAAPVRRGRHRGHRRLQPGQPQPGLPLPRLRPARRHRGRARRRDPHQGGPAARAPTCTWTPRRTPAPRT